FQELDVYGVAAITAFVAKHPETNQGIFPQSVEAIEAQIYTMLTDIGCDALKTGMLFTEEIIEAVAWQVDQSGVSSIVIDPVMIGKMGSKLLKDNAIEALKANLLPQSTIMTPNMYEAAYLLGEPLDALQEETDLIDAARR